MSLAPGVRLAGTLTMPTSGGPFPAVLLITGSGPEDRDETVFGPQPAPPCSLRSPDAPGIAVLRVDDRGVAVSSAGPAGATTDDLVENWLAGVAFLKSRPGIDAARIGLIGHSEGGLIAPLSFRSGNSRLPRSARGSPACPGSRSCSRRARCS